MRRLISFFCAASIALQPFVANAQAIRQAIRDADQALPHMLPIADRADRLPLPYVPEAWQKTVPTVDRQKSDPAADDDDSVLPTVIAVLKPKCTSLTTSVTSTTAGQPITLTATCTFKGSLQRRYSFFSNGNYLGEAAAGSNFFSMTPATAGTYRFTAVALNGSIPSNAMVAPDVTVNAAPMSGCYISGPSSLSPPNSGTFTAGCASGGTGATYQWSRDSAAIGGNTSSLADAPFTSGSTVPSVTYSVLIGGSQSATLTVANSAAVGLAIASLSTGGTSTQSATNYPTRTVTATFTKTCTTASPSMRIYANGSQIYSGPFVSSYNFAVAATTNSTQRVDATLICSTAQVAALQQVVTVAATPFGVTDVEDPAAPNATGTTVGSLPGSASVNPTGAVTYSIPVPISPGTAGMQPSLALSYSSQAGRGILGTGWSLSGFSTIHRCPASIVLDGFKGRIGFDDKDRYCLDGMRLLLINGAEGGAGAEYRTERDSYARIFALGSSGSGLGPTSWTVETKSGQTLTFNAPLYQSSVDGGSYDVSRIKAWGISQAADTVGNSMSFNYLATHQKGWLLPSTINYTANAAAGLAPYAQVQISYDSSDRGDSAIVYDGTGSYGEVPPVITSIASKVANVTSGALDISHQLNLAYESSPTTGRTRLSSAQVCGGGAGPSDGLCLPATTFAYNNAAVSASTPWIDSGSVGFSVDPGAGRSILALDTNGDGKTDLLPSTTLGIGVITNAAAACSQAGICAARGDNETPVPIETTYLNFAEGGQLGDFNGDGVTDLVTVIATNIGSNGFAAARYLLCLGQANDPTRFQCEVKLNWTNHIACTMTQGGDVCTYQPAQFQVGDFDGDGKSDLLDLRNGNIYFGGALGDNSRVPRQTNLTSYTPDQISVGDFDGDGRLDIAALVFTPATGYGIWTTYLSRVSRLDPAGILAETAFAVITNTQGPRKRDYQPHIADVNGDGLADLLGFDGIPEMWSSNGVAPDYGITPYLGKFRWHGCLSRGNGTFDCSVWRGPPSGEFDFNGRKFPLEVLGDFNGDGRTDLAIFDPDYSADHPTEAGRWWICVARPNPPSNPERGAFDCGPELAGSQLSGGGIWRNGLRRKGRTATNPSQYGYDIVVAGDFNGDGRTGIAGGTPTSGFPRITRLNVPDPVASIPDMLQTITNGLGFKNTFKYKPITDNGIYTKGTTSTTYPVLDIQTAMYVATEASHDDGLNSGGVKTYSYKYAGLTGHTAGGGSLGFANVSVTDGQSGIVTTTTYDNSYPARGLITSTEKRKSVTAGGERLNLSTTTYKLIRPYTQTASYRPVNVAAFPNVAKHIHQFLPTASSEASNDWDGTALPITATTTDYGVATPHSGGAPGSDNDGVPVGNYYDGDVNTAFGCATSVSALTSLPNGTAQASKATTNQYENGIGGWRYCRLTQADVVSTQSIYTLPSGASSSESRSASFTYYNDPAHLTDLIANSGLLKTEVVQVAGAPEIKLTTTYAYDGYGNRVRADVLGFNGDNDETRTSTTSYDTRGRYATGSVNALGHLASASYSNTLGVTQTQTFDGLTVTHKYDKLGRKVTELRPDGTKTAMSYGTTSYGGVKVSSKVTGGGQSSVESDTLGREALKSVLIDKHDDAALVFSNVRTLYDVRGRVDKVSRPYFTGSSPNFPCSRQYDDLDRVYYEQCANDDSPITSTSTTFKGLRTEVAVTAQDATGTTSSRTSVSLLDARGMTQQVTNAQGNTVNHAYDAAGNLVQTTRTAALGAGGVGGATGTMVTVLTYDLRGRKKTLSDPDTGNYSYDYNAFGELIRQTDGKGQLTRSFYDALGRIKQRVSTTDLTSTYDYDTCPSGRCLGKLIRATSSGLVSPSGNGNPGYVRTLGYDGVGRLNGETTNIANPSGTTRNYSAGTTFDAAGRVDQITYPNGQYVTRIYDRVGGWNQLIGSGGNVLWKGGAVDAEAHFTNWTLGNTLTSAATFGVNTGRLQSLSTSGNVQGLALTYDGFGNIRTRLDVANNYQQTGGSAESYTYDTLNQLLQANTADGVQNICYDGFGRIVAKSSSVNCTSGTYDYPVFAGASGPNGSTTSNRLLGANGRVYTYDNDATHLGNGNVVGITGTSAGAIMLSWTSFNQPMVLPVAAGQGSTTATNQPQCSTSALPVLCLKYGPDNERRLELLPMDTSVTGASQTASRYILHSGASLFYEEDVRQDGSTEQRAYLAGPLGIVALHATNTDGFATSTYPLGTPVAPIGPQGNAQNNNGTPYTLSFWHRDHLGSLTVTTDENALVKERMRYDPWGKPQTGVGTPGGVASTTRAGERGFTGHEHLAGGLIHMNGRIYDPVLGRFLSADIVVQMPSSIVSYNRYAYVMNNPLALTDPSGYFFIIDDIIIAALVSAGVSTGAAALATYAAIASATAAATGHRTAARRFIGAALIFATGGLSGPDAAFLQAAGAFAAGGIQSGSLEGAVVAGISFGVGQIIGPILGEVLTSAVTALSNAVGTQALAFAVNSPYVINANGVLAYPDGTSVSFVQNGHVTDSASDQLPKVLDRVEITAKNTVLDRVAGQYDRFVDWRDASPWFSKALEVGAVLATRGRSGSGMSPVRELSSNAARREAMRKAGIPTSQQPIGQSQNASGREYTYKVTEPGGGTNPYSVQQQTMDRSHVGQNHWEAGPVKTDPVTGDIRYGNYGRPALTNEKIKIDYP